MPIVIRAKKNDSTSDVIKKFKKFVASANVLEIAKDREFYFKPSAVKNIKNNELKRQKQRSKRIAAANKSAK